MEKKFKPFDKVLVRNFDDTIWMPNIYGFFDEGEKEHICIDGEYYKYCIPFEGNEHLIGKTEDYAEPYEPKDGDFVKILDSSDEEWILIWKGVNGGVIERYVSYVLSDRDLEYRMKPWGDIEEVDLLEEATEEERELLIVALHEKGKDWDAENKQIVDYKWKPERGGTFYFPVLHVDKFFATVSYWYDEIDVCKIREKKGWVFKTEKECQVLCDKLNKAIEGIR